MKKHYKKIKQLVNTISSYRVSLYAANTSFYFVLSFFPLLMLILSLLPYFGISETDLLYALMGITPTALHPILDTIVADLSGTDSRFLISATAVGAVWSASRGVYCMQEGLNAIHGVNENRSYAIRRLGSMLYTLLVVVSLLLTFVIHGFGQELAALCEKNPIPILVLFSRLLRFRGLIMFFLLSGLFTGIYCVLPNKRIPFRFALPGAVFSALGWQVFTYFFSYYVRYSGSYSVFYGSLSGFAVGMFWLYVCFSILFYGCILNIFLNKRKQ